MEQDGELPPKAKIRNRRVAAAGNANKKLHRLLSVEKNINLLCWAKCKVSALTECSPPASLSQKEVLGWRYVNLGLVSQAITQH